MTRLFRRVRDQCRIQENWHNIWPWLLWVTFAIFCQPFYKLLLTFAHLIMLDTWIFKVQKNNWTDNLTVFLRTQLCPFKQDHTQKSNSPSSILIKINYILHCYHFCNHWQDYKSGRSKKYGFVEFDSPASAEKALNEPSHFIDGSKVWYMYMLFG